MILIADSGSSKTDWRLIDNNGQIAQTRTTGINPYYQGSSAITKILETELLNQLTNNVEEIYFYGAGCSSNENKEVIHSSLQLVFEQARISVDHDLTAAAKALCGDEPGIACILGTGANSCLYDGQNILHNIPALGYILGDEGSGAYMGKKLVASYIQGELPSVITTRFKKRFDLEPTEILNKIYKENEGAPFLARFSKFIFQNISDPYLYKLVYDAFDDFFIKNVVKYENYINHKVHFTGSVAFYYSNILRQVANDKGIKVQNITESPIAGLALYHQKMKEH